MLNSLKNLFDDEIGGAVYLKETAKLSRITGTADYMSKEMIEGSYGFPADLFAVGKLTYNLLRRKIKKGRSPFKIMHNVALEKPFRMPMHCSEESISFMNRLLCHDPNRRATCKEALSHPFLQQASNESSTTIAALLKTLMLPVVLDRTFSSYF